MPWAVHAKSLRACHSMLNMALTDRFNPDPHIPHMPFLPSQRSTDRTRSARASPAKPILTCPPPVLDWLREAVTSPACRAPYSLRRISPVHIATSLPTRLSPFRSYSRLACLANSITISTVYTATDLDASIRVDPILPCLIDPDIAATFH